MPFSTVQFIAFGIFLIFFVSAVLAFRTIYTLWLQALLSGVRISLIQLVVMRLRKVDARLVVRSLIMAAQAGVPISTSEMESAWLQGVDLEKITLAMIHASRENMEVTFQDLVDADQKNRLAEKLGLQERRQV